MASGVSLDGLIVRLKADQRRLSNLGEPLVDMLADQLVTELKARAPGPGKHKLATGNLYRGLTRRSPPHREGNVWKVNIGDLGILRSRSQMAPRGTIADFLRDYRHEAGYMVALRKHELAMKRRQRQVEIKAKRLEARRQRLRSLSKRRAALELRYSDQLDKITLLRQKLAEVEIKLRNNPQSQRLRDQFAKLRQRLQKATEKLAELYRRLEKIEEQMRRLRAK